MAVACYCCSFYRSFTRTCTLKAGVKGEGSGGFGGRWRWSWSLISALSVGEKKNTSCPLDLNRWPFLTLGRHQLYALCSVSATCRYPVERGFARCVFDFCRHSIKTFSSFNLCRSLPSVATDDRKHFQSAKHSLQTLQNHLMKLRYSLWR